MAKRKVMARGEQASALGKLQMLMDTRVRQAPEIKFPRLVPSRRINVQEFNLHPYKRHRLEDLSMPPQEYAIDHSQSSISDDAQSKEWQQHTRSFPTLIRAPILPPVQMTIPERSDWLPDQAATEGLSASQKIVFLTVI